MSKSDSRSNLTPVAAAMATVLSAGFAAASAQAAVNPFQVTELGGGYMQLAEGSCGGAKGEGDAKGEEGSCGGAKGEDDAKGEEGSCGEAKCGGAA